MSDEKHDRGVDVEKLGDLTFHAERLGDADDIASAYAELRRLLVHASPVVREGAVYGLAKLRARGLEPGKKDCPIEILLRNVAEIDASPGVREAAREALED